MKIFFTGIILALIIVGAWFLYANAPQRNNGISEPKFENKVLYMCKNSKTIQAVYLISASIKAKPGERPIPNGSVDITLSDGRTLSLPQTISASGIRYANSDESIVFWSKGNGAFLLEHNKETYMDCIAIAPESGNLSKIYANSAEGFSLRYPADYLVNTTYQYEALGPGKEIKGVKFTIPLEMSTGTNLSGYDTGISIEEIPNIQNCTANLFIYQNMKAVSVRDADVEYSVATTTGVGLGNYYDETVWAFPGTNPCIAVRYLIHSMNIQNYTPGAVHEFDRKTLLEQFDAIRRTLTLL